LRARVPETFVAIAAKVCPSDVRVTLEQQIPGNLSPDDWATMREIVEAVRQAIPDASSKPPGAVLSHTVVPDPEWPKMYRVRRPDGSLTDMVNLIRAGDAARALAESLASNPAQEHPYAAAPRFLGKIVAMLAHA
jgi:hypothetical protein